MELVDRFRGSLVAGALGDALGAPVEFSSLAAIRRSYGAPVTLRTFGGGGFTDDTQMTLFTAEGLIRASVRGRTRGISSAVDVVHRAYLRWLHTQGTSWPQIRRLLESAGDAPDGWLVGQQVLHRQAAPGNTCLAALRSGEVGTREHRLNNSKGCGGVMRAAPAGLLFDDVETAYRVGCDVAAITHSHPSGYLPAGALAAMVSQLTAGADLHTAVATGRALLDAEPEGGETAAALDAAVSLAAGGVPEPEDLETLGGGWVGEEALAIAVACALTAADLPTALSVAAIHSGDSDSTAAICGNLLGAQLGIGAVPRDEMALLEGADVVDRVAQDLARERLSPPTSGQDVDPDWAQRYPGW